MRIVVTGAAGFIGANLVRALNARGETDIVAVDDLTEGDKFRNLRDCTIEDYLDKDEFLRGVGSGRFGASVGAVLHQGACADTMQADGRFMMENNYRCSRTLLDWCQERAIPLVYASTAAVYGATGSFDEDPRCEAPLNVYGWSKLLFDQVVRRRIVQGLAAPVVGLRYFNVYGPGEAHKGRMASVAHHLFHQLRDEGHARLFEASHGCAAGEQRRDFVWVGDAAAANLHFLGGTAPSGVYNVGTGLARSFNDVAMNLVNGLRRHQGQALQSRDEAVADGTLRYVPFPAGLRAKYQAYTCAQTSRLRDAGYTAPMTGLEAGIAQYLEALRSAAA